MGAVFVLLPIGACSGAADPVASQSGGGAANASGGRTDAGTSGLSTSNGGLDTAGVGGSALAEAGGIAGYGSVAGSANAGRGGGSAGSNVGGGSAGGGSFGSRDGSGTAGAISGTAGPGGLSPILVPAQGALLGAFVGTGAFSEFEMRLGRSAAIKHTFVGWSQDWASVVTTDAAASYIPLVTWEAWDNGVGASLDAIIGGAYDAMIQARANATKSLGKKFFLRWGHEMNGNWYPWDGFHNGANTAASTKYIAAYRHVHDVFTNAGGGNALWVFCPNVDSVPGDSWNGWSTYYPGDGYVDWVAFDGYNWGTVQAGSSWISFPNLASHIYSGLAAKGKPIMIPETASAETGGDKAGWIAAILPALKGSFPQIKAFVWFDMNKETDWRVSSSPGAQQAFLTLASDPYMNP